MAKYIKSIFFILIFFGCGLAVASVCSAAEIADENAETETPMPVLAELAGGRSGILALSGCTASNTDLLIYINGTYFANAVVEKISDEAGRNKFFYADSKPLPEGSHDIMLIARDRSTLVLSPPLCNIKFVVPPLPAPTVIGPSEKDAIGKVRPLITGLAVSGTYAKIFIDGVYNGKTNILSDISGAADFAYEPFLNLSVGKHEVWAVSEDANGRQSAKSQVISFDIEDPMPAPTIIAAIGSAERKNPVITGVAKNNSLVKIFVDHKLAGQFRVSNHNSGTASFAFKAPINLTEGEHLVYTTAIDARGKESAWSNVNRIKTQLVPIKKNAPKIETAAREENNSAASEIGDQHADGGETEAGSGLNPPIPAETEQLAEIEDSLKIGQPNANGETGLIDESKEQQSKLNLNTVIFIIFLLSAAGWIIWVNRELNKEKEFQEFPDDEGAENKNKLL